MSQKVIVNNKYLWIELFYHPWYFPFGFMMTVHPEMSADHRISGRISLGPVSLKYKIGNK